MEFSRDHINPTDLCFNNDSSVYAMTPNSVYPNHHKVTHIKYEIKQCLSWLNLPLFLTTSQPCTFVKSVRAKTNSYQLTTDNPSRGDPEDIIEGKAEFIESHQLRFELVRMRESGRTPTKNGMKIKIREHGESATIECLHH